MLVLTAALPLSLLVVCIPSVVSQVTHTVTVGLEGSFYNPPTMAAGVDDTIEFVFAGNIHTVTQSSFENPCLPLPGGFNSGLAGRGANFSASVPTWNLRITNVTDPIWFFCQATQPSSHCAAGMVGAINPPSQSMYARFVTAAKAVRGTPTPNIVPVLRGIGAFATNTPAAPTNSNTESPASPGQTGSQQTETSSAVPSSKLAATVGGTVGGVLGALLILIVIFFLLRHRRVMKGRHEHRSLSNGKNHELHPTPFRYMGSPNNRNDDSMHLRNQRSIGNISNPVMGGFDSPMVSADGGTSSQRFQPARRRRTVGSFNSGGTARLSPPVTSMDMDHATPTTYYRDLDSSAVSDAASTTTVLPRVDSLFSSRGGAEPAPLTGGAHYPAHTMPARVLHPEKSRERLGIYDMGGGYSAGTVGRGASVGSGAVLAGYNQQQQQPPVFHHGHHTSFSQSHRRTPSPERALSAELELAGQQMPLPGIDQVAYSSSPPNYMLATRGHESARIGW